MKSVYIVYTYHEKAVDRESVEGGVLVTLDDETAEALAELVTPFYFGQEENPLQGKLCNVIFWLTLMQKRHFSDGDCIRKITLED